MQLMYIRKTAVFLFLVLLCIWPEVSLGHAFPDHADPRVGATVTNSPTQVRIWFSGALEPAFCTIVVQDTNGKRVDKGDGHVTPSDVTLLEVSLPQLSPGLYHVIWNVVARDGHPTVGDYSFVIK